MVHILTEESELPVTRRPPDPERAEIGWNARELSYIVQLSPEPDLPFFVCVHQKVVAQKSRAGHQTLVTCQSLIDTRVTMVLDGQRAHSRMLRGDLFHKGGVGRHMGRMV